MLYLKKIRKGKKIPQGVLAEQIGISQAQLSLMEHGKYQPRVEVIIKLGRFLDADPAELMQPWDELKENERA